MKLTKGAITAQALPALRDELLKAKRIEDIQLAGLAAERRPIIAGGILVLEAAFQALGLEKLMVSKAAMREGILYDMLGRGGETIRATARWPRWCSATGSTKYRQHAWKPPPAACSTKSANPGNWMATMRKCCAAPHACTSWG